MTSKERVELSLNHKTADRVPIDLGGQSNTSLTRGAYINLCRYYGEEEGEAETMATHFQTIEVPETYLSSFGVDFRSIKPGKPMSNLSRENPDGSYIDYWGVTYSPAMGGMYFDITNNPLKETDIKGIEQYRPFDPLDVNITSGVREKAERIFMETEYAVVANLTEAQVFERAWYLRGLDKFLMDLCLDEKLAHALLRVVTDIQKERVGTLLEKVGKYVSIVKVSDDLSGQLSPLISPDMYRKMIKPYHKEYFEHIKQYTNALVALHCCGNVRPLLPDLIDSGVEVIHPFQFSCPEMDPVALKADFGKDIIFWGGMDTQKFLPYATPPEIKEEVRKMISLMGEEGGFIFAPTHNLQPDIPPENIIAMYEEAQR